MNRRQFIKSTAIAATAVVVPGVAFATSSKAITHWEQLSEAERRRIFKEFDGACVKHVNSSEFWLESGKFYGLRG